MLSNISWYRTIYSLFLAVVFIIFLLLIFRFEVDIGKHFAILPTMLLGSFVAGSTPMGGGSVAYPILVHYLEFGSADARTFSLLIQSVGMTSASLFIILYKREELPWGFIGRTALAGLTGFVLSTFLIYELVSPTLLKVIYIPFFLSFLIILLKIQFGNNRKPVYTSPDHPDKSIIPALIAGFCGGILSGFIGNGIDFMIFTVLVLYFGYPIKKGTFISIILMTIISLFNSMLLLWDTGAVSDRVLASWFLAANLVLFGAPLGNFVMRLVSDRWVTVFVGLLFSAHVIGVFASMTLTVAIRWAMVGCFIISFIFFLRMYQKYNLPEKSDRKKRMKLRTRMRIGYRKMAGILPFKKSGVT